MTVAVLYNKVDNSIHDYLDNITLVEGNKITFVGGYAEGWNTEEIGLIVTNELYMESKLVDSTLTDLDGNIIRVDKVNQYTLRDNTGKTYKYGDTLPNVRDIQERFSMSNVGQRILDLEVSIAELLTLGGA